MHVWNYVEQSITRALLIVDQQGTIKYVDPALLPLLGYSPKQLLGQAFELLCVGDDNLASLLIHDGAQQRPLRHQNGTIRPCLLNVSPLINAFTEHHIISMMDVAQQQHLNDALAHTQRLAGVGTLTASVAHELTNPLTVITSACGNLLHEIQDGQLDQETLVRYIELIEQSAFRSARIVEVLRNYTHLGGPEIAVTTVQMLVHDSLTLVEQQFRKQANVTIEVDQAADLRSIVCDHNRIIQVLVNLLSNARDAMQPDGGVIKLKFWSITNDEMANDNHKQAPKEFAFSVRDSGHGIAPHLMDKIFQPFFTTKSNGQGTGLGLYIAQDIVAQHNGRFWAENNTIGGATFTVVLPHRPQNNV